MVAHGARRGMMVRVTAAHNAIVYQGEPGANSHIACLERFPERPAVACASFEDAFAEVSEGRAELAMIPIDNTVAGRVADIHLLLPRTDLHIIGEHYLPIRFSLMGIHGSTLDTARTVHSHIHALGQCRDLIRSLGLTPVVAGDTAGAAREVADWADPTKVALAPPQAADLYGLKTLAPYAEDSESNTTRFVILSRNGHVPTRRELPGEAVTTFVFQVRNIPAALYKALGGFATNGINMTRLESYMGDEFASTQFMADVEGHPEDRLLRLALDELRFFTTQVKILGVYPADDHRILVRHRSQERDQDAGAAPWPTTP